MEQRELSMICWCSPTLALYGWTASHLWQNDESHPPGKTSTDVHGQQIQKRQDTVDEGHHCRCQSKREDRVVYCNHGPCGFELWGRYYGHTRCTSSQPQMVKKLHSAVEAAIELNCWEQLPCTSGTSFQCATGRSLKLWVISWCKQKLLAVAGSSYVCCGDFRQIPSVIPGGGRQAIIHTIIKSS